MSSNPAQEKMCRIDPREQPLDSLVSPRSPMTGPFMIYVYLGDSSRSRISFARCAG
jgi:hypothetical protein